MHLTEYDIASYLERKGVPEQRLRMEQHLADCAACAADLAAAVRVVNSVEKTDPPELPDPIFRKALRARAQKKPWSLNFFHSSPPFRYALAGILVASVGWWAVTSTRQEQPSRFRSSSPSPMVELVHPPDEAVITALPVRFQWQPSSNALQYRLTLFDDEGTRIWQGESAGSHLTTHATVAFEGGKIYLWTIEAILSNGLTLTSNLSSFRYAP